jgi:hypothetical protein
MTSKHRTICLLAGLALAGCQNTPTTGKKSVPPEPTGPIATVNDKLIKSSVEETTKTQEYTFTVANTGDQPLELTLTKKSCLCTEVALPKEAIAPGKSAPVVFRWLPQPGTGPEHRIVADLRTNDPKQPNLKLEVLVRVNPIIRLWPRVDWLDFGTVNPEKPAEKELKIFSTRLKAFDLELGPLPNIEITKEPLEPNSPISDNMAALSGYRLTFKTTDKLPPNYYRADLKLTIKAPNEEPRELTLPVYATVGNGFFTIAPTQVEFKNTLVTDEDRKWVEVRFTTPSDQDSVKVDQVEPAFLTTTTPFKQSPGVWRFEVKLPKGNAEAAKHQADSFFEGRILLKISGSPSPVAVRVKWDPEK